MRKSNRRLALKIVVTLLVVMVAGVLLRTPSHDRIWEMGQEQLPHIVFEGDVFTIENLRDFEWTGAYEANARYVEESFDVRDIESVDVVVSHFSDYEGMAHIFLSFGFADGRHVSISLEARREADETYSPWLGLLRQYEIIYVVGTDRDLIGVRTGYRDERVYIYPTVATASQSQALFMQLAEKINALYDTPRFYNTLTHNCTNELTREVEQMSTVEFPFTYRTFLPGFFDEVLYEMALLDNSRTFNTLKIQSLVANDRVDESRADFATHVREMVGK